MTKTCGQCGRTLPATTEFFHRDKNRPSGLYSWCKECNRARRNQHYADHAERYSEYNRSFYAANAEEKKRMAREWHERNPERARAHARASAARRRRAPGNHTAADVDAQYARQRGRCYWCGERVGQTYHVDHVIPLKLGGSNAPENIVVACPRCNQVKHAKHPMDFAGRLC